MKHGRLGCRSLRSLHNRLGSGTNVREVTTLSVDQRNDSGYASMQEKYMDEIHIAESAKYADVWGQSLYQPMHQKLLEFIETTATKYNDFAYIGCGPNAPLFYTDLGIKIINKFENITLIDLSKRYLRTAQFKGECLFPKINMQTIACDITGGLGDLFTEKIINSARNQIAPGSLSLPSILKGNLPANSYDCIYSELVATYTGVPALKYFEEKCRAKEDLQNCLNVWQGYNDKVVKLHIADMYNALRNHGISFLATDIEKRYKNNHFPCVAAVTKKSLSRPSINFYPSYLNEDIIWDDTSLDKYNRSTETSTFPHYHIVGCYGYKKSVKGCLKSVY